MCLQNLTAYNYFSQLHVAYSTVSNYIFRDNYIATYLLYSVVFNQKFFSNYFPLIISKYLYNFLIYRMFFNSLIMSVQVCLFTLVTVYSTYIQTHARDLLPTVRHVEHVNLVICSYCCSRSTFIAFYVGNNYGLQCLNYDHRWCNLLLFKVKHGYKLKKQFEKMLANHFVIHNKLYSVFI